MNQTFPGVTLRPYIYSQWKNHLHFDFGKGKYQNVEGTGDLNMEYFSQLYTYNKYLFEEIFSEEDEVFLVTNAYRFKKENVKSLQKIIIQTIYLEKRIKVSYKARNNAIFI